MGKVGEREKGITKRVNWRCNLVMTSWRVKKIKVFGTEIFHRNRKNASQRKRHKIESKSKSRYADVYRRSQEPNGLLTLTKVS